MAELRTGTQYPGGGNIYFKLDFDTNLDVGNFVKFARSFYQSKGIEESVRILLQ